MNILNEKLKLFGPAYRCGGDGGGGSGGSDGADGSSGSGTSGASSEGSGSSSGPGGGPSGGPGSSSGGSSGSGSSSGGSGSGPSGGMADGPAMSGPPDATDTDGTESLGSTTVSADSEADAADPGSSSAPNHAGMFANQTLNSLFNRGGAAATGLPVGMMNNIAAAVMGNHSVNNQAAIINSIFGMMPVVGQLNGLMGMMGMPTVGSTVANMGGVPASSVASDPSASGGDSTQPGLGGLFGTNSRSLTGGGSNLGGLSPGGYLGVSSGDPLLASLFNAKSTPQTATNKFLKDIMENTNG